MCYEYSLRKKKATEKELENRREAVSMRKRFNAWTIETKKALVANKPKQPDSAQEAPASVRERLTG